MQLRESAGAVHPLPHDAVVGEGQGGGSGRSPWRQPFAPIPTFPRHSRGKECMGCAAARERGRRASPPPRRSRGGGLGWGQRSIDIATIACPHPNLPPAQPGEGVHGVCSCARARAKYIPSPATQSWGRARVGAAVDRHCDDRLPPSQPSPGAAGGRSAWGVQLRESAGAVHPLPHDAVVGEGQGGGRGRSHEPTTMAAFAYQRSPCGYHAPSGPSVSHRCSWTLRPS